MNLRAVTAVLVSSLGLVAVPNAGAEPATTRTIVNHTAWITPDLILCSGEIIPLTGTLTFILKETTTAKGHVLFHQHEHYRLEGMTALRQRVRLHEQISSHSSGSLRSAQTGHLILRRSVKVQGESPADDFLARGTTHVVIDANGVLRVRNSSFTQECI